MNPSDVVLTYCHPVSISGLASSLVCTALHNHWSLFVISSRILHKWRYFDVVL